MKYAFAFLGLLLLIGATPKGPAPITVTVNGEGTLSAAPDIATVWLAIQTSAPAAETATSDNNSRYNDLRNKLRAIGLPDAALRTVSYNVNNYMRGPEIYSRPQQQPPEGFTVSREIQVTTKNLDQIGAIVDAALAARATGINNVAFTNSQDRTLYSQALKMAVADAQRQAEAMAQAAHLRILRISSLQTGGFYPRPMIMRAAKGMAAPAPGIPTEIQSGNLDIHANVTATYVLGP